MNDARDLSGLQAHHHLAQFRLHLVQSRLLHETQIPSVGGRVRIFGVALGQHGEIFALLQPLLDHEDLLPGFVVGLRFVIFQISDIRIWKGAHQNLRHVDLRLHQVEAGLVGVIEIRHIGVADADV